MRACGQKLVKFCTHTDTHTTAAKLVVRVTFVLSLTQMLVFLSLYVMLSILLSILVCAAASLFCACLVSVHVSAAPYYVIAGSTQELYKRYGLKVKVWFYIALYPVRWTAQSALHFPPLADLFIPTPFSASLGSILAMQQLRNDYSLTFPPLSIARYSFIQLSRLRRREVKENAQTSKR